MLRSELPKPHRVIIPERHQDRRRAAAENSADKIGRITTAGVITEFPMPIRGSFPVGITMGTDGALWFTEAQANKIGRLAVTINTHDYNGDGYSDIAWRDTSGNVAIWEMNGTTVLNPNTAGVGNVPTTWSIVGTGDFNGDGRWDILWSDTSGNVAIWEMNGTTVLNLNTAGVGNVATTWSIVGTGDFNGDGKGDVLWRSGNIAIWEMNGTTVLNPDTAGVGNVTTNFKIAGSGDFNGDGKSDVLWRDTTGGNVAIWFMNGTSVLNPNPAGVGNVPIIWTIQDALGG
jgi:FG-GAP-like repeat/FG-GAP repeat